MIPVIPLEACPIQALQIMLRRVLSDTQYHTRLVPDGIYGEETRGAVSEFQRRNALEVNGEVDLATWNILVLTYRSALVTSGKAEPLQIVLQPEQVIRSGDINTHIYIIQALLSALDRFYLGLPVVRVTGKHDAATTKAVVWLQERAGLPADGHVDKHTWRFLVHLYRLASGDGSGRYPCRQAQRSLEIQQKQDKDGEGQRQ